LAGFVSRGSWTTDEPVEIRAKLSYDYAAAMLAEKAKREAKP
jgi:hypothetical protein